MKKPRVIFIFMLMLMITACSSEQPAALETEQDMTLTEESIVEETSESISETANVPKVSQSLEIEGAPEVEGACETEDLLGSQMVTGRSIQLEVSVLRPSQDGLWMLGGNKVYFGHFEGKPMAYRILASTETQTIENGQDALLLDCDFTLLTKEYDADGKKNDAQEKRQNQWNGSDLQAWLNRSEFIGNQNVFTDVERNAIATTSLAESATAYYAGTWTYDDFVSTDEVFMLSAEEANHLYGEQSARVKAGTQVNWWLRSSFAEAGNGVGSIHSDGHICNNSVNNYSVGVSPAFNVDLDAILFASASGFDKSMDLAEDGAQVVDSMSNRWELTLIDESKSVTLTKGSKVEEADGEKGTLITIPYTYTGEDVTQISVMITDKTYTEKDARVLYYGALQNVEIEERVGTGTFTLPYDLKNQTCGSDYFVYLLAESVNGEKETDYASLPFAL